VEAITVGVNGASLPPAVPKLFLWRDEESGTDIIAMWHPYGYGGYKLEDCVTLEGLDHAFVPAWRGDNDGPATKGIENHLMI